MKTFTIIASSLALAIVAYLAGVHQGKAELLEQQIKEGNSTSQQLDKQSEEEFITKYHLEDLK